MMPFLTFRKKKLGYSNILKSNCFMSQLLRQVDGLAEVEGRAT
jgi:hypothetical protein